MTSTSVLKKVYFLFDILATLIGMVLIAFGIYVLVSYDTNEIGSIAAIGFIVIGVATLVIFAIGSPGAMRENVCCMVIFTILLVIVILAQLAAVYLLVSHVNSVASNLANSLDSAWEEELKSPGAMSIYENWFECCGRASPQDYIVNDRLPPSTCYRNNDITLFQNLIENGCRMQFENYWIELLNVFNLLTVILIVLECIGSFVTCCFCNSIRNDKRRTYF